MGHEAPRDSGHLGEPLPWRGPEPQQVSHRDAAPSAQMSTWAEGENTAATSWDSQGLGAYCEGFRVPQVTEYHILKMAKLDDG